MPATLTCPKKGFGTMSMTWVPAPNPLEESVERLNYVKTKYGVKLFNCGEFYQNDPEFHNLKLMKQFVTKYPDEDVIIVIKGGIDFVKLAPTGTKEGIAASIANCISFFKDVPVRPKLVFEPARVDPNVPIEETVAYCYEHVKNGDIDGVALSEVGAESIRKAAAVCPIFSVEVEFSLLTQDIIKNGILAEASKHQIPILAYSPVGRGFLTDFCVESDDYLKTIHPNDMRITRFDRFKDENFKRNLPFFKSLYDFAKSKGMSLESLALSYLESLSGSDSFGGIEKLTQIVPIPSGSTNEKIDKNYGHIVQLSKEDISKIQKICDDHQIHGFRYNAHAEATLNG